MADKDQRGAKAKGVLPCGRPTPASTARAISPERLERWKERLKSHLSTHGLKFSEQRWQIAQFILGTAGHFNAQDIVREVTAVYPAIGAATVYRNIKVLCDAKILRETLVDKTGRIIFEVFDEAHHDHIVCLDCSEIFEFHDAEIEARQAGVTEGLRFDAVSHRHVIYARCLYKQEKEK